MSLMIWSVHFKNLSEPRGATLRELRDFCELNIHCRDTGYFFTTSNDLKKLAIEAKDKTSKACLAYLRKAVKANGGDLEFTIE